MEFYKNFADQYDTLVSFENRVKREAKFYDSIFKKYGVKTVLDCACGTGHHVMMFKQLGYEVQGSDLSPAMVNKAQTNLKQLNLNAKIKVADFKELSKHFDDKFDSVICVGNSLPHLLSDEELISAFSEMNAILKENGILILEQRNYDKLIKNKKRIFPVSIKEEEAFIYVLDFFPTEIVFNIVYINLMTKAFQIYNTTYNILKMGKLKEILNSTGLKIVNQYGDYDFNEFNIETSDRPIIVCKKS
jgi:ubiquinone/menaquinone biosynthesis C-methylase UbiE